MRGGEALQFLSVREGRLGQTPALRDASVPRPLVWLSSGGDIGELCMRCVEAMRGGLDGETKSRVGLEIVSTT